MTVVLSIITIIGLICGAAILYDAYDLMRERKRCLVLMHQKR